MAASADCFVQLSAALAETDKPCPQPFLDNYTATVVFSGSGYFTVTSVRILGSQALESRLF